MKKEIIKNILNRSRKKCSGRGLVLAMFNWTSDFYLFFVVNRES